MKDRDVVDAFVAHLAENGHPGLKVDRRPDEEERNDQAIDAIAGPFAIEHTSVDTLDGQRRDSAWFMQVAGGLEEELRREGHAPPYRLNLTLEYDAIGKGQNFRAIRAALKSWIVGAAPSLADGGHVVSNVSGIPFPLHVGKSSERKPGVFFSRYGPEDDTLAARVKALFDRKAAKLAKYQGTGATTILLVENDDIAQMNEGKMVEAIREAFPKGPPAGVDRVWYADTSIPRNLEFKDFTPQAWGVAE